jgi:N utilization substance protein A
MRGKKQKEPAGMNPQEIFAALALIEKERNIPQTFMLDKIIQALTTAYKKDHEGVENVIVDVDEEHQDLRMYVQKNVVAEEDYVDPANEISEADAKAMSAKYAVGDIVNIPVPNVEFGRIAAGNGKQVIIQGLREAERGMVYDEFNSKQHEILTGVVTRVDPRNGNVSLRIGTGSESTEALLMAGEQVKGEVLEEGMHVKVYVVEVRRSTRGPQVLISRTHPGLVKRLFELEVPEIFDGTVEVKSIAREAGSRTKMAVWSNDPNVDPIGACVGPKGQRVESIVSELRGEKIDIVKYSDDPPSSSPPPWRPPTWWTCGWRTRARPAACWCRTISCLWPSARRGRTPAWPPASPAIRSTSSPRVTRKRKRPRTRTTWRSRSDPCPGRTGNGSRRKAKSAGKCRK